VASPYHGTAKDIAFTPEHELTAANEDSLLFFYQVKNGQVTQLGDAATVLGG
jgi:hypothetical protein